MSILVRVSKVTQFHVRSTVSNEQYCLTTQPWVLFHSTQPSWRMVAAEAEPCSDPKCRRRQRAGHDDLPPSTRVGSALSRLWVK